MHFVLHCFKAYDGVGWEIDFACRDFKCNCLLRTGKREALWKLTF